MKKRYMPPEFIVHGNVRSLTQVLGPLSPADTLSIGGQVVGDGDTTGSRDFSSP